jgi:hypothetical protein
MPKTRRTSSQGSAPTAAASPATPTKTAKLASTAATAALTKATAPAPAVTTVVEDVDRGLFFINCMLLLILFLVR